VRGDWGIYTHFHRKLAVDERVSGYSGYLSGYSGHWGPETSHSEQFTDGEQLPEDFEYMSGYSERLCLDIPDQDPDTPGLAGNFTRRLFIVVGLIVIVFVGSLEHKYHVNTCRSKYLLIVRYSYTQFQNKMYSSSKFETPFFIFPFQGSCFVIHFA
jgi:hypothetical protein